MGDSALNGCGLLPHLWLSLARPHAPSQPPYPIGLGCKGAVGIWPQGMLRGQPSKTRAWLHTSVPLRTGLRRGHVAEEPGGGSAGQGQLFGPCRLTLLLSTVSPLPATARANCPARKKREMAKTKASQAISAAATMRCPRLRHGARIHLPPPAVQAGLRLPGSGLAPSQGPASRAGGWGKQGALREPNQMPEGLRKSLLLRAAQKGKKSPALGVGTQKAGSVPATQPLSGA